MTLTGHATVLLVADVPATLAWYRDALGFDATPYDADPAHYGFLRRDACAIHVARFEGAAARPNSAEAPPDMFDVYVYVDDVDVLFSELLERGTEVLHGPVEQGYGLRELRVRDPSGYVLAFGQPRA